MCSPVLETLWRDALDVRTRRVAGRARRWPEALPDGEERTTLALLQPSFKMSVKAAPKQINPILAAYLTNLAARPILTKSCTSAVLSFVSEIIAGQVSGQPPPALTAKERTGVPPVDLAKRYHKAIKMAAFGFFVSAPMGHALLSLLQKAFKGKDSARAKVLMIVVSNLLISPIQQSVFITAMALIGGANSSAAVLKALRMSFVPIMKLTWVVSTLSMATAQKFIAPELWVPFFNIIGVTVGTFVNVKAKKQALIARATAQAKKDAAAASEDKKADDEKKSE